MDYKLWARWYDIFYAAAHTDDIAFYVDLARRVGGPVLEIGVGTGRVAIPIAKAGIEITGVDLNQPMLEVASRKAREAQPLPGGLTLARADMTALDLGDRRFNLAIIPARALLHALTEEDQYRTLCCAARHLVPGATVAFDIFYPDSGMLHDDPDEEFLLGVVPNEETGGRYILSGRNRFDLETQVNHGRQTVEELDAGGNTIQRVEMDVTLRYLHPHQAVELAERAGLSIVDAYGGFDGSRITEDSEDMVFICRAPDGPSLCADRPVK